MQEIWQVKGTLLCWTQDQGLEYFSYAIDLREVCAVSTVTNYKGEQRLSIMLKNKEAFGCSLITYSTFLVLWQEAIGQKVEE